VTHLKRLLLTVLVSLFATVVASCQRPGSGAVISSEGPDTSLPQLARFQPGPVLPPNGYGAELPGAAERSRALLDFIHKQMTGPFGIYTNRLDTAEDGEAASGHEVLSESASLLLRADVLSNQPEHYESDWQTATLTFALDSGFSYRYSPKHDRHYPLNAAVDDLRLIRSLYEAGEAFHHPAYTLQADKYSARFMRYNVKNGYMYDFYDAQAGKTNDFITLCYIDLQTLSLVPPSPEQKELIAHMAQIISGGYLSDSFPFYQTRYDYASQAYSSDSIHTVESMLTILALSEVHLQRETSIEFIRDKVKSGQLYGAYTLHGQPVNNIQSTAIYAIAAMIGSTLGDQELYEASIARMNAFQLPSAGSGDELAGGFADAATGQAYSFDNLMALLAYSY
jgi:hypothetical protein